MSPMSIGLICIIAGIFYGLLIWEPYYNRTLGYLVSHEWIKPPKFIAKDQQNPLGPKTTIIFYSLILIAIGIFMLVAT